MTEREPVLRPVVDPELPDGDRTVLEKAGAVLLVPANASPPPPPRLGGRTALDLGHTFLIGTLCGFLPAVALPRLLPRLRYPAGAAAQAALVACWWFGGFGLFLLAGTALQVAAWAALLAWRCGEHPPVRLGREHHGRYYLDADFGGRSLDTVRRAQVAITAVTESRVDADGLLDDVANDVALPRQQWEIAQTCAELTRLKRRLRKLAKDGPAMEEALAPQWRALELSGDAVERRVTALERYAERTREADAAYQALRELEEISAGARELLARTVRDELAVAEIDGLADLTPTDRLRQAIEEARRAALDLAEGAPA